MKILMVDIETSPNLAYVWGLFKQNISIDKIVDSSTVMCWSAKWYGQPKVFHDSIYKSSHEKMLKGIHALVSEAHVVVSYNGKSFDMPTLNKEFYFADMGPPEPYRHVDLLETSRKQFNFVSNKLDYVGKASGVGQKIKHAGFQLWVDCMAKKADAWKKMEEYNKQDVLLLEKLYAKMIPWIKNHPNHNLYSEKDCCPKCGGTHYHSHGTYKLVSGQYRKLQCIGCRGWFKGEKVGNKKARFKEI